jgi:hypothetical protein
MAERDLLLRPDVRHRIQAYFSSENERGCAVTSEEEPSLARPAPKVISGVGEKSLELF